MLRAIPPTDPVLVLGITETPHDKLDPGMIRDLFGFSRKNSYTIQRPAKVCSSILLIHFANIIQQSRQDFFLNIIKYVKTAPKDFPEPLNRKKRKLEVLAIAPPPPVKPPTKEEIKALKKRDHQVLNLLKITIQPVMDQINRKYKKFRNPVIAQSQIQYLFNEKDPDFVRPDIPQFRPFEIDQDKNGIQGLRETATGKFFYNLDTTLIEERLSNGFYARPKDFLADIRSLAKDAKNIGDKERQLKANELLSNAEVDIASYEANPLLADCENVYLRQLQRVKEKEEKLKKKAAIEGFQPLIRSDVQASGADTDDQGSGPVTLGVAIPGGNRLVSVTTPPRPSSVLSNGVHHPGDSNGYPMPSRANEDVQMAGSDTASQIMQPPNQQLPRMSIDQPNLSGYATGGASTQVSQRSGFQELPTASAFALINDASTTTSGKTSDKWSTQATNGVSHQESSPLDRSGGDSQLPDTQGNSSQSNANDTQMEGNSTSEGSWIHSQAHALARGNITSQTPSSGNSQHPAVPPFPQPSRLSNSRPASMANILNDSPIEPNSSQISSQKEHISLDDLFINDLLDNLTNNSSGCSVEQLEQINRELMEKLWEMRGELNRNSVAVELIKVFNETIIDIEEMQRVLQASQPSQMNA